MTQTTIVVVNVSTTNPPQPSKLQRTGAIISQGGTITAQNTSTLLTELADLAPILAGAITISAASWSSNVASITTATAHPFVVGDPVTIAGMTPSGYNGTVVITGSVDTTHFTYALLSNPGSATVFGVVTDADVSELVAMATTFFAQGNNTSVYVLELGHGTNTVAVAALAAYITANPLKYYAYLIPRGWDSESTFVTLAGQQASNTSKVYFFTTVTLSTYTSFTVKSVYMMIEAPSIPATEFSIAGDFYWVLSQNPSSTNKVPPTAFGYRIGVTAYPITNSQKSTFKAAYLNYIGTGAEGGISNAVVFWGTTADGKPLNYWYSVDWVQINLDLAVANRIINGSNNPLAPLYYNQPGINDLQNVALSVFNQGVSFGLVLGNVAAAKLDQANFVTALNAGKFLGQAVVNADPFNSYTIENPTHYALGRYDGLSAVYSPQLGFTQIVFLVNVNLFV